MDRGADVVHEAGQRQLGACACRRRSSSAASSTRTEAPARASAHRRGEPVGPGADDDRVRAAHAPAHGWRARSSRTSSSPASIRPVFASWMR